MIKFAKLESALGLQPTENYGSLIFTNEEKRKEWEETDPSVRNHVMHLLKKHGDAIEMKLSIEFLANAFIDLQERIEKLERKNDK